MNLEQIAEALGGNVFGDATLEVDRAVHPADANRPRSGACHGRGTTRKTLGYTGAECDCS